MKTKPYQSVLTAMLLFAPLLVMLAQNVAHAETGANNVDPDLRAQMRQQRKALRTERRTERLEEMGIRSTQDITYVPGSQDKDQQLDLMRPAPNKKGAYPVIVFIHGGGWHTGGRKGKLYLPLVQQGFAVATISYRLAPANKWPAQIYDCKAAVRWVRAHAGEYNLDPNRVGAWGDSAGGHLAAMLGVSPHVAALEGDGGNAKYSSAVQAVADWFGASDLTDMRAQQQTQLPPGGTVKNTDQFIQWLFGGPLEKHLKEAKEASPITYVSAKAPPFFIVHGDADTTIPIAQSKEFVDALKKDHVDVTFRVVQGANHGVANVPAEAQNEMIEFFKKTLGHSSTTGGGNSSVH